MKVARPRARRLSGSRRRELAAAFLYLPCGKRVSKRAVNFAPKSVEAMQPTVRQY
jgi:hypothetical protein